MASYVMGNGKSDGGKKQRRNTNIGTEDLIMSVGMLKIIAD